jgi:hypothetical protein
MRLNLPILDQLQPFRNILIAGAGGGYDIFAGLPLYDALRAHGKTVHLANYSFTEIALVNQHARTIVLVENELEGATADIPDDLIFPYYPEGMLARWFKQVRGEDVPIWMFDKTGPGRLSALYRTLIDTLQIEALVLVDGGVDSLMRGDEELSGTLLEDSISLCATHTLDLPMRLLACMGFGTEPDVAHNTVLENIAALAADGAFLGSCALTSAMDEFVAYEQAYRTATTGSGHKHSHIHPLFIAAVRGEFGSEFNGRDFTQHAFVSPLMSLYWFFDLDAVARRSLILDIIASCQTLDDIWRGENALRLARQMSAANRPHRLLPY